MSSYPYCQICEAVILNEDGNFIERNPARAIDMIHGVLVCGAHLDVAIVRAAGNPVLADVLGERRAQDEQWGGPEHDDHHELEDWLTYIRRQYDRAVRVEDIAPSECRGRLVKLAALAVAAIESYDRREARA